MENPQPFVGIDVSSQRLDVDTVPVSQPFSEPNTEDGIASLVGRLKASQPPNRAAGSHRGLRDSRGLRPV